MKQSIFYMLFLILSVHFISCEKEQAECNCEPEEKFIDYPEKGLYGDNLLIIDSAVIKSNFAGLETDTESLSFRSNVPEGQTLKVKLTAKNHNTVYLIDGSTQIGWSINTVNESTVELIAIGQVAADFKLTLFGTGGLTIEIFENGATSPTKTKLIDWNPTAN